MRLAVPLGAALAAVLLVGCSADDGEPDAGARPVLGHSGVGPFELGMSAEALIAAGGSLDADQADPCSTLRWTSGGHEMRGAIGTGTGLGWLRVGDAVTPEGISVGSTLTQLRAAYPGLHERAGAATYRLGEAARYRFELDAQQQVRRMTLVAVSQPCG